MYSVAVTLLCCGWPGFPDLVAMDDEEECCLPNTGVDTEDMPAGLTPADDDAKLGVNSDALRGDASPIPTDVLLLGHMSATDIEKLIQLR